jgi:hypothetical protein
MRFLEHFTRSASRPRLGAPNQSRTEVLTKNLVFRRSISSCRSPPQRPENFSHRPLVKFLTIIWFRMETIISLCGAQPVKHEFIKTASRIGKSFPRFVRVQFGVEPAPIGVPNRQTLELLGPMLVKELHYFFVPAINPLPFHGGHVDAALLITLNPLWRDGRYHVWRHKQIRVIKPIQLERPFGRI